MNHTKIVSTVLITSALFFALSACQRQAGPAEQAGKEIDKAAAAAGQQIEKAGESIKDAANGKR